MSDRPIEDATERLTEVRDSTAPREIDGVLDLVRGDVDNVRRLVERATRHAGRSSTLGELDAVEADMERDIRGLGDTLAGAVSEAIDELTTLKRPPDGTPTVEPAAPVAGERPPVIHVSSTDAKDAKLRRDPPPNTVLVVDETTTYTTDAHGRVVKAEATLTSTQPGRRNKYAQRTLEGKLDGDDAGHLIARMLGGIGDKLNLVPMQRYRVNQGEYRALEAHWKEAITDGHTVDVSVELDYDNHGPRPSGLFVTYEIDGEMYTADISNEPEGES